MHTVGNCTHFSPFAPFQTSLLCPSLDTVASSHHGLIFKVAFIFFERSILLERCTEQGAGEEKSTIFLLTTQMAAIAGAGQDGSQESGMSSRSPTWELHRKRSSQDPIWDTESQAAAWPAVSLCCPPRSFSSGNFFLDPWHYLFSNYVISILFSLLISLIKMASLLVYNGQGTINFGITKQASLNANSLAEDLYRDWHLLGTRQNMCWMS